jgi:predicted short-subunit dehydrogenase-like oxidoreductase (DUF2520 family)
MPGPRLGFIGAGRVALALSRAWMAAGENVVAVWSRSSTSSAQDVVDGCDIVFLTVPDDSIRSVCAALRWRESVAAVHCSGAAELDVLAAAPQRGAFHPLLMFAAADIAAAALKGAAIAIEASEPLRTELERLAGVVGARVLRVPPGQRPAYHAASHYAAAFLCVLMGEGEEIFRRIGFERATARSALVALARSALDALDRDGPSRAMAGTYSRGDAGTAAGHLSALEKLDPALLPLYRTLALKSVALAVDAGRISAERAEQLRRLLE